MKIGLLGNKKVKAHMAHASQKNLEFHIMKIRTLSKVKVIQCQIILKVWPTGDLLFTIYNAITNKKKVSRYCTKNGYKHGEYFLTFMSHHFESLPTCYPLSKFNNSTINSV